MAIDSGYWGNGKALDSGYWESDKDTNVLTNADRIRAMSDEELAELLHGFCWNGEHCYSCPLYNKDCAGIGGVERWNEWLQQPVKEE